jgi:hypothetical protein
MYMRKLKNLSLKTIVGIWAILTKGTEWLLAIQLTVKHGSGQIILPVGSNCIE